MKGWFLLACIPIQLWGEIYSQPEIESGFEKKFAVYAGSSMVVTANPYATEAGYEVLERGGSAMDAAVAIQMVLNVTEPQSSGIGGGALFLYYDQAYKKVIAYDGRECAPFDIDENLFQTHLKGIDSRFQASIGGKSVGVPGVLKVLKMGHDRYGKLEWKTLFERAITWAEKGFPISHRLAELIAKTPFLDTFKNAETFLFHLDGSPKNEGEILKNPELAETFRHLASQGLFPFYEGEIGQAIEQTIQKANKNPGKLTMNDLKQYKAIEREPLIFPYNEYTIYGFPPPSSGGISVCQILGLCQHKDLSKSNPGALDFINIFCQASRLAFADRNYYIADPDFSPVPTQALLETTYLKDRSDLIKSDEALKEVSPGVFPLINPPSYVSMEGIDLPSTSHFCVVDKEGNAISLTTSLEKAFGSTLWVRGFFLNSQLTDFSFISEKEGKKVANRPQGGKRPMSNMAPTFVFDGNANLVLAIGSAGGAAIIDYVAQSLLAILQFKLGIQSAIDFPHYTGLSKTLWLEANTFVTENREELVSIGNQVEIIPMASGTQAIEIHSDYLIGGADSRREGSARGN